MKIASLQYAYDFPTHFQSFERKIKTLIAELAKQGVDLVLFPEYAGFEMASIPGWEELFSKYLSLFQNLAQEHHMYICSGTHVVKTKSGTFNRSYFFSPSGKFAHQDKCLLTPYEVEEGILSAGNTLTLFETQFGKVGICICYDVEFPRLVETLINQGVQLILVPSYTSSVHGFYRVFISCRARALEHQCYVVQSAIVGQTDVEMAFGAAAVCTPIDDGFPEDGLLALGKRDQVETIVATLDFERLKKVRTDGQTHNHKDAQILSQKTLHFNLFDLR